LYQAIKAMISDRDPASAASDVTLCLTLSEQTMIAQQNATTLNTAIGRLAAASPIIKPIIPNRRRPTYSLIARNTKKTVTTCAYDQLRGTAATPKNPVP